jgi:hypothetical protein
MESRRNVLVPSPLAESDVTFADFDGIWPPDLGPLVHALPRDVRRRRTEGRPGDREEGLSWRTHDHTS